MAPITKSLALVGSLLAAFASAAPVDKRDQVVEVETVTSVVWTTVDLTTTVTVEPTAVPSVANKAADHTIQAHTSSHHTTSTSTAWEQPAWTAPAVPSWTWSPEVPAQQWTTSVVTSTTEQWHAATTSSTSTSSSTSTTVAAPAATTSASSSSSSSSSSGSSSSGSSSGACSESSPCAGDITYYEVGLGSCGWTNTDSEHVLALSHTIMQKEYCGKEVTINYGGKTAKGKIVDTCMGCEPGSIDLSSSLFLELAELGSGRVGGVDWYID
ncbi:RlpA-like double-psi beta-barrel domain-containing protein [Aspergillus homomorphus CBS 101889]|uniref:RlpA-like protein double-psi beta-barrel domain-containing protein n=1 Tax=Aspergillus homomorphus (strain CBS 101889) TaxID=1450537 RepID=A0A395IEA2_ASPHC|nr:hypothetical protein BO97DRAFT_402892 [Aspergillus homomorphus CBS 101889]RAL16494.1 hypothetical protein BO97DRAFT_402892 [Aspergillus homomorphus CBS 101889]